MVRVIVLHPNGKHDDRLIPNTLEGLQGAVGGIIGFQELGNGLVLVYHDEALLEDADPNLWGLVLGAPFAGTLVLVREERHDHRIDVTDRDVARMTQLREILKERLVKIGLLPAEPYFTFISWPGDVPDDLQPKP